MGENNFTYTFPSGNLEWNVRWVNMWIKRKRNTWELTFWECFTFKAAESLEQTRAVYNDQSYLSTVGWFFKYYNGWKPLPICCYDPQLFSSIHHFNIQSLDYSFLPFLLTFWLVHWLMYKAFTYSGSLMWWPVFPNKDNFQQSPCILKTLSCLVDRYQSCCWISNLVRYADSQWSVSTKISLSRRSDSGKVNSSPVSKSPAIVRFQQGCQKSLKIPVEDPDGDFVKCRWATSAESSIPSDSFPYGELDEVYLYTLIMFFPCFIKTWENFKPCKLGWLKTT